MFLDIDYRSAVYALNGFKISRDECAPLGRTAIKALQKDAEDFLQDEACEE